MFLKVLLEKLEIDFLLKGKLFLYGHCGFKKLI